MTQPQILLLEGFINNGRRNNGGMSEEKKKPRGNTFDKMTPEQRSECGRKGGKTKAENFRKRKELKETLNLLLSLPLEHRNVADIEHIQAFAKLNGKNVTVDQAMMIKVVQRALKGDLQAIAMIRDTIGEKPAENVNVDAKVTKNPLEELSADELRDLIAKHSGN